VTKVGSERVGPQSFEIPWEPTAWARPRAVVQNGRARFFTSSRARGAVVAIRLVLMQGAARMYPAKTPLTMRAVFRVRRPLSARRGEIYPATRPDIDAYIKLLMDAGTGVLWQDDAAIAHIDATKTYDMTGGTSIRLEVEPIAHEGGVAKGERKVVMI
jgi:Holliday junction resolvase RusA-like endonuclease